MNIFKRLAARISPTLAFNGLIKAIEQSNTRAISWFLPLCSSKHQTEALNFCVREFHTDMFTHIFPHVQSTRQTLNLAANKAAMGHLEFFEQILPTVSMDEKMHALRSLIRWIDDAGVSLADKWQPIFALLNAHGVDRNCMLEEAVKLNNWAVFEHLFSHGNCCGNLTRHLNFYQDKRIVDTLIPHASPTEIEDLLNQAAWIGNGAYIRQLASLCDDHSRALAKVIAGSAQISPKDVPLCQQNAEILYPRSTPSKTLEYLYTDHEEFMDDLNCFDNILLKDLHERIEILQQRAVLLNAVGENTASAPRRKM